MNRVYRRVSTIKILVVDDNHFDRQIFIRAIKADTQTNYEFSILESGSELENVALAWKPHLIILDSSLPGLSGIELLCSTPQVGSTFVLSVDISPYNQNAKLGSPV